MLSSKTFDDICSSCMYNKLEEMGPSTKSSFIGKDMFCLMCFWGKKKKLPWREGKGVEWRGNKMKEKGKLRNGDKCVGLYRVKTKLDIIFWIILETLYVIFQL